MLCIYVELLCLQLIIYKKENSVQNIIKLQQTNNKYHQLLELHFTSRPVLFIRHICEERNIQYEFNLIIEEYIFERQDFCVAKILSGEISSNLVNRSFSRRKFYHLCDVHFSSIFVRKLLQIFIFRCKGRLCAY